MRLVTASFVVPMESPPIEGGALLISGDRILEVGTRQDLQRRWPGAPREDHPGNALIPALVNAHAHLELTGLGGPPPTGDFVSWLLHVIGCKKGASAQQFAQGIVKGARACRKTGQGFYKY